MKPSDPIATLQVAGTIGTSASELGAKGKLSSVTSVCWIANGLHLDGEFRHDVSFDRDASDGGADEDESIGSEDDDEWSEPISFQCHRLAQERGVVSAPSSLSRRHLVSCHANGSSYLWDLERQRIAQEFVPPRGGPGLLVRRSCDSGVDKEEDGRLLYQTRDLQGTVSCHLLDASRNVVEELASFETHSQTFCAAAPCHGNPQLIALPSEDDTVSVVRDWRSPPSSPPVARICTFLAAPSPGTTSQSQYGMLTSLALTELDISGNGRGARPLVACGMESGHVLLFDLAMTGASFSSVSMTEPHSGLELGKDPVLTLDMVPSVLPKSSSSLGSVVTIAGLAGSSDDLATRPESAQGRVAVIKASLDSNHAWHCRLRARLATCSVPSATDSLPVIAGKPGVSICRFRPDGQLFAVGGWDKRVRIFDRSTTIREHSEPRALLRGHSTSVTALDWAPDAASSGLLATGGNDGRVNLWTCFGSSMKSQLVH